MDLFDVSEIVTRNQLKLLELQPQVRGTKREQISERNVDVQS